MLYKIINKRHIRAYNHPYPTFYFTYEGANRIKSKFVYLDFSTECYLKNKSPLTHKQQRTGPINIIDLNESIHTDFVSPHNKD